MSLMALMTMLNVIAANSITECVCPISDPNCADCFRLPFKFGKRGSNSNINQNDYNNGNYAPEVYPKRGNGLDLLLCDLISKRYQSRDDQQLCRQRVSYYLRFKSKPNPIILSKIMENIIRNKYY